MHLDAIRHLNDKVQSVPSELFESLEKSQQKLKQTEQTMLDGESIQIVEIEK